MFKHRPAALIGTVAAAALLVSACGLSPNAPPGASANELTVWYFDKVSMDTVIPLFEQSHPGVKVTFVQQPFGDMSKKYLAALAAKQGVPDVIGLDTSMVGQFLDAGENLLAEPYSAGQFKDDFVDWKFNAAQTSGGQMTAIPWDVATGVMFYRPAVFQAAGLPTEHKQLAWEFTRFLTTNPDALNAVFQKTGIVPAYKPAWDSPLYDQPVPYLGGQAAFRLMLDLAQQVKPLTYSPVDALGTDLLNAQVDLAIAGQVAPDEALQTAATQLQDRALRASNLQLGIASS